MTSFSPTFPTLVSQVSRQWRRALDAALQPLGLTEATWRALLHASRASTPLPQKDLARIMGLDSSSVVRLLGMLERDGHIQRLEDPQDKRIKRIVLTPAGRELGQRVEAMAAQFRERMLGGIAQADMQIAMQVLQQLNDALLATEARP